MQEPSVGSRSLQGYAGPASPQATEQDGQSEMLNHIICEVISKQTPESQGGWEGSTPRTGHKLVEDLTMCFPGLSLTSPCQPSPLVCCGQSRGLNTAVEAAIGPGARLLHQRDMEWGPLGADAHRPVMLLLHLLGRAHPGPEGPCWRPGGSRLRETWLSVQKAHSHDWSPQPLACVRDPTACSARRVPLTCLRGYSLRIPPPPTSLLCTCSRAWRAWVLPASQAPG